jgi:hypothetical protein
MLSVLWKMNISATRESYEKINLADTNCSALEQWHNTLLLRNTSSELVFTSILASKDSTVDTYSSERWCHIIANRANTQDFEDVEDG